MGTTQQEKELMTNPREKGSSFQRHAQSRSQAQQGYTDLIPSLRHSEKGKALRIENRSFIASDQEGRFDYREAQGHFLWNVLYLDFGVGYMTICVWVVSRLVMSDS